MGRSSLRIVAVLLLSVAAAAGQDARPRPPLPSSPSAILRGPGPDSAFGESIDSAGDVDGDGYDDVVVGSIFTNGGDGAAYLYRGGPGGLRIDAPSWSIHGGSMSNLGRSVAGAGDVNGDGYADVIVSAPTLTVGTLYETGAVYLFTGSEAGLSAQPAWSFNGRYYQGILGLRVAGGGDFNGDGLSDLAVTEYSNPPGLPQTGMIHIFFGSRIGPMGYPDLTLHNPYPGSGFGWSLDFAGDTGGDGLDDLLVGMISYHDSTTTPESFGAVALYPGLPYGGIDISGPDWIITGSRPELYFGFSVAGAGDLNGDGFGDILMGETQWTATGGTAHVVYGRPGGLSGVTRTSDWSVTDGAGASGFAHSVASAGDVNADGFDDVIIGAPDYAIAGAERGRVVVHLGGGRGLSIAAAWSFVGPLPAVGVSYPSRIGHGVAAAGDVNGDGAGDVLAGDPNSTVPGVPGIPGGVWVFHGRSASLKRQEATFDSIALAGEASDLEPLGSGGASCGALPSVAGPALLLLLIFLPRPR